MHSSIKPKLDIVQSALHVSDRKTDKDASGRRGEMPETL